MREEQESDVRVRSGDIEGWLVAGHGQRSLHLEQAGADKCASSRGDVVIYPLVKAALLLEALQSILKLRDELREERSTLVVVEHRSQQTAEVQALVATLKEEVEVAKSEIVHIHPNAELIARLKAEGEALKRSHAERISKVVFKEVVTVPAGHCLEFNFETGEVKAVPAP